MPETLEAYLHRDFRSSTADESQRKHREHSSTRFEWHLKIFSNRALSGQLNLEWAFDGADPLVSEPLYNLGQLKRFRIMKNWLLLI